MAKERLGNGSSRPRAAPARNSRRITAERESMLLAEARRRDA
jgi:hypothetical protein